MILTFVVVWCSSYLKSIYLLFQYWLLTSYFVHGRCPSSYHIHVVEAFSMILQSGNALRLNHCISLPWGLLVIAKLFMISKQLLVFRRYPGRLLREHGRELKKFLWETQTPAGFSWETKLAKQWVEPGPPHSSGHSWSFPKPPTKPPPNHWIECRSLTHAPAPYSFHLCGWFAKHWHVFSQHVRLSKKTRNENFIFWLLFFFNCIDYGVVFHLHECLWECPPWVSLRPKHTLESMEDRSPGRLRSQKWVP